MYFLVRTLYQPLRKLSYRHTEWHTNWLLYAFGARALRHNYALFSRIMQEKCDAMPPTNLQFCTILACAWPNGIHQLVHCPLGLSRRKVLDLSHSYAQYKLQNAHFQTILRLLVTVSNATHLSHYGARLAEDRRRRRRSRRRSRKKKMNNSKFQHFLVCHFKLVTSQCYYYCGLEQAL